MKTQLEFDQVIKFPKEVKYFSEIEDAYPIVKDSIVYKSITGIGATYGEIKASRNSIIMFPHKSIIWNKQEQHKCVDNTFAVCEGVTVDDIMKYLNTNKGYKKFLTTPSGLLKIKCAVANIGENLYEKYFLLIDECERWIKDNGFRDDLLLPMDDFFQFKEKAMVSATPIPSSDPRLKDFKRIKIEPDYDFRKQLTLLQVNDIVGTLRNRLNESTSEHVCIFFNSTTGIRNIMSQLGIESDSKVFCSDESVSTLRCTGFDRVFSKYDELGKYNFFTSSFYSGFDIVVKAASVEIIIITDVSHPVHSMVDPITDVFQILGRFRNGYSKAIHINHVKLLSSFLTEEELMNKIDKTYYCYKTIKGLMNASPDAEHKEIYAQVLSRITPYATLLDEDGTYNYFKQDNLLHYNRVRSYYCAPSSLQLAYIESGLYHFKEESREIDSSRIEGMGKGFKKYSKKNIAEVLVYLQGIEDFRGTTFYVLHRSLIDRSFSIVSDAYDLLGVDSIKRLKFNIRAIKLALIKKDFEDKKNSLPVIDAFYESFRLDRPYLRPELKHKIQEIYELFGMVQCAKASHIEDYFDFQYKNYYQHGKSHNAYVLTGYKFNRFKRAC